MDILFYLFANVLLNKHIITGSFCKQHINDPHRPSRSRKFQLISLFFIDKNYLKNFGLITTFIEKTKILFLHLKNRIFLNKNTAKDTF